jgi:uridine kinase
MTRDPVVRPIADFIRRRKSSRPLSVGVDGIDAAGKTTLADSLRDELERCGSRVIRASLDGFHNPAEVRHARGNLSPEGYFYDSFDYGALKDSLLLPLGKSGGGAYRLRTFDFATDAPVESEILRAPKDFILLFDGVFLFRPELLDFWDVKIFLDISFGESLRRALRRDRNLFQGSQEIEERYTRRYLPGQKLYWELCHPKALADLVVHNEDFSHPILEIIGR